MTRDLDVMTDIMKERDIEIVDDNLQPLDPEGVELAKHKRFTLDMVGTPVDPLR